MTGQHHHYDRDGNRLDAPTWAEAQADAIALGDLDHKPGPWGAEQHAEVQAAVRRSEELREGRAR